MLVYTEDVMFWTNNAKELEENLNQLNNIQSKFVLKINSEKTAIQKISRNTDVSCINLKGRQLKEVDTLSHLGSVVTCHWKILNEKNERIKKKSITILSRCT